MEKILLSLILLSQSHSAMGFVFLYDEPQLFANNTHTYHLNIPGVAASGITWEEGFSIALSDWSNSTPLSLNTVIDTMVSMGACDLILDGKSRVSFTANLCSEEFAARQALAAAQSVPDLQNPGILLEGNIFFDESKTWHNFDLPFSRNLFTGEPIYAADPGLDDDDIIPSTSRVEFISVSRHEIGHTLGLGHTIFPKSIMKPSRDHRIRYLSPDDLCGVNIYYGVPENCHLTKPTSSLTGDTTAIITGGVSSDKGLTYATEFISTDSLDVMSTVVVEPGHVGQVGKLHVVALLDDGSMLAKEGGDFVDWDGDLNGLPATESKSLDRANEIYVLEDLIPAQLNITAATIKIFTAYSVDSDAESLIYTLEPITFTIKPE